MTTQRVNVYISGSGLCVFYIEQYNEQLRQWFTVGDTYNNIEHANAQVERHNTKNVLDEVIKLEGAK